MTEQTITVNNLKLVIQEIANIMGENKTYLCNLDSKLGDGDIGLSMSKGFQYLSENLEELNQHDIGGSFIKSGLIIADKAPSTIGALVGSAFMEGGKSIKGKSEITSKELAIFFNSMNHGIKQRGNAKQGDKTILDAMIPASKTFSECVEKGEFLNIAIEKACKSAENGMNDTIRLQSKFGRASRYLEDSIGLQDPGATVGYLLYKGFKNSLIKL